MKKILVFFIFLYTNLAFAEGNLPDFPLINLDNVTIGKNFDYKNLLTDHVDECSSKSGNCSAYCDLPGCTCTCSVGGCLCYNPDPEDPEEGGGGNGGGALNLNYKIDESVVYNLTKSADYFKNLNTDEGNKIYLALFDVAVAINNNNESDYLRKAHYINTELQMIDFAKAIAFNHYALEHGISLRL